MSEAEVTGPAIRQAPQASTPDRGPTQDLRLHAGPLYPSPLEPGARLQEFEISAVIGQGGFGIVYLARDLSLQRSVAIKEYFPAHLAGRDAQSMVRALTAGQADVFELGRLSFINEARMLARFKHPGLVEVLRFWEQNGTAYMAMPFYDGATLTRFIKHNPGVATEEWLRKTLKPLIDALGHMHAEDCFHRDVAPDNILILKNGTAVLLDLGAARRVIANDAQAMTVMLKSGYAPIEQYSDDPRFRQGPWTDIYAMAAVFFFAVTGKAPPASASRVMRDSVSPLSRVHPEGFSDSFLLAIDKGLSLQPEDRPRSIAEFRSLLYAGSPTEPPAAGGVAARTADRCQHTGADDAFQPPAVREARPLRVAAGFAVLTLVLAVGWLALLPGDAPHVAATAALPAASRSPASPPATPAGAVMPADGFDIQASAALVPAPAVVPGGPDAATATAAAAAAAAADTAAAIARFAAADTAAARADAADATAADPAAVGAAPEPPRASAPATRATAEAGPEVAAEGRTPAAATGTVLLAVRPWAEVRVNGVTKGISPPMKQLTLPAGQHTIEFRNPASAPVKQRVEVRASRQTLVRQEF